MFKQIYNKLSDIKRKKSSSIRPYFPVGDITEKHYFYSSLINISTQFNLFKFRPYFDHMMILFTTTPPQKKKTLVREKR